MDAWGEAKLVSISLQDWHLGAPCEAADSGFHETPFPMTLKPQALDVVGTRDCFSIFTLKTLAIAGPGSSEHGSLCTQAFHVLGGYRAHLHPPAKARCIRDSGSTGRAPKIQLRQYLSLCSLSFP